MLMLINWTLSIRHPSRHDLLHGRRRPPYIVAESPYFDQCLVYKGPVMGSLEEELNRLNKITSVEFNPDFWDVRY